MKGSSTQITLDMRSDEGRVQVCVDISALSTPERIFLFGLLQHAQKGVDVGFGVGSSEDDRLKVIQFTLPNPLAPNLTETVKRQLAN